jgi:hypothetical protein
MLAWDAIIVEGGQSGTRPVIHDIEPSDAMVVIVVDKEFHEVLWMVFCSYAKCDIFVDISGNGCDFAVLAKPIDRVEEIAVSPTRSTDQIYNKETG